MEQKKGRKYTCKTCKQDFKHHSSHSRHEKVCGKEKKYKCKKCQKFSFKRKDSLKRHLNTCNPKSDFICNKCGLKFDKNWLLQRHIKKVDCLKKGVSCQYCNKAMKSQISLNKHLNFKHQKEIGIDFMHFLANLPEEPELEDVEVEDMDMDDEAFEEDFEDFEEDIRYRSMVYGISDVNEELEISGVNEEVELFGVNVKEEVDLSEVYEEELELSEVNGVEISRINAVELSEVNNEVGLYEVDEEVELFDDGGPTASGFGGENGDSSDGNTLRERLNDVISIKKTSRTRKKRLSKRLANCIKDELNAMNIDSDEEMEVLASSLRKLGFKNKHVKHMLRKDETRGRKKTSLETRKEAFAFWHKNSEASTITSRPAKIKLASVPDLQKDLSFHSGVKEIINKRKIKMLVSPWLITKDTYHTLYSKFITESGCTIGPTTFRSLRPFYIRAPNSKDIELCCCKIHLHARWAVTALLKLFKKQKISHNFDSYETFFSNVIYSSSCKLSEDASEYIKWECTPNKKCLCDDIQKNFITIKEKWNEIADPNITVKMLHFVKRVEQTKKGKVVKRLKPESIHANLSWVIDFIESWLAKIIHHRNLLKNFRTNLDIVLDSIDKVAELGLDFSENITLPVNKEPQPLHFGGCKDQKTVHSGLSKSGGQKTYHAHISDDLTHDQAFVKIVMKEMLEYVNAESGQTLIISSDNCMGQYKSSQHFHDLQNMANLYEVNIIRLYGIPGHGKNEIDTVGGTQKIALRRAVAHGMFFSSASSCVDYLDEKFRESESPVYDIKEVYSEELDRERNRAKKIKFKTVNGSSRIRVMMIEPNSNSIKAAPYLCVCELCLSKYGSCPLFKDLKLISSEKVSAKRFLRSEYNNDSSDEDADGDDDENEINEEVTITDYFIPDTVCAIAQDKESKCLDPFIFVYIVDTSLAEFDTQDDFGHKLRQGQEYVSGFYLEKKSESAKGITYYVNTKQSVFFFKESLIYPFVNFEEKNNKSKQKLMFIESGDYIDVIMFVEKSKMALIE